MNKNFNEINGLLLQLLDTYGSRRDRKAGKDMYTCPLCHSGEHGAGSTGALNLGRKDGTMVFYCHSCGVGGNISSLWCEYHNEPNTKENFPRIIKGIKQDLGIPIEENNYDRFKKVYNFRSEITQSDLNPQNELETKKDRTKFYSLALKNQKKVIEYLNVTRKIKNAERIAREFQIGFMPNYAYEFENNKPSKTTPAVIVPFSPYSYAWRSATENLKRKSGEIFPLNLKTLQDSFKKWIFLVEGEYDLFSILDIQYSIENAGNICEFSAISVNSAVNLPKFIDMYIKKSIQDGTGLIIALDNDIKFNPNVEYFKSQGLEIAKKNKIPCVIADVKNLYLNQKDSNEALQYNRQAFQQALINEVEKAKKIINSYMKECEKMENQQLTENLTSHQSESQAITFSLNNILESIDTLTYEDFHNNTQKLTSIINVIETLQTEEDINAIASSLVNVAQKYKSKTEIEKQLKPKVTQAKKRITQIKKETEKAMNKLAMSSKYPEYIKVGDNGKPYQTIENCLNVLQNDKMYKGRITFNEFSNKVLYNGKQWKDENFSQLVCYMESRYNITIEKKIRHAFVLENKRNSFHPIKNYLNDLKWDGVQRLSTLFIDFLGADDNPYTRTVSTVTLCGAVARVLNPGVKFDTMPVLVGKQGVGKSTIWAKLGGEWFSDTLDTIKGKEAYESIQNSWIIEIAELSAMAHATKEDTKKFITKTSDKYRKPYAETVEEIPRQCIFVGTTNDYEFLKDETGNRRFYPIDVDITKATKSIWNDLTQDYINQLWAEAKELYLKHSENAIYIKNEEILKLASNQQQEHFEKSTTYSEVEAYLTMPVPPDWDDYSIDQRQDFIARYRKDSNTYATEIRKNVCIREILMDLYPEDYPSGVKIPRRDSDEISKILSSLGWKQTYRFRTKLFGQQRMFTLSHK